MTERDHAGKQSSPPQPNRAQGEPTPEQLAAAMRGSRRREPRYVAFLLTGVLVGVLVAVGVTLLAPATGQDGAVYSPGAVFGYLAASFALVGGLLGGLVAVLAARRR